MNDIKRRALSRGAITARPIGAFTAPALDRAARGRGFATSALLSQWQAIVGADLAQFTMPDRVVWPRRKEDPDEPNAQRGRRNEGAVLILRVDGPRAIEVQHRSDQILERVNGHFGYRAVSELRILQAPVKRTPKHRPAPPRSIDPKGPKALADSGTIEDQGLRAALARLGSGARAKQIGD